MTDQVIELARQEGHSATSPKGFRGTLNWIATFLRHPIPNSRPRSSESRYVRLYARDDGTITFEGQDLGPSVEEIFGDSDYEYWVHVPAKALQKLAFELLREKYTGQLSAVEAFRDWCKMHNIEHKFSNYA